MNPLREKRMSCELIYGSESIQANFPEIFDQVQSIIIHYKKLLNPEGKIAQNL